MQLNTPQSGFAWLPILLGMSLVAAIGTGSTAYYIQTHKQQDQNQQLTEQVESLQQQTQDLQTQLEKQEDPTPTASPEPSPTTQAVSQVKAAATTKPAPAAPKPQPTQAPQVSKKDQCEAQAIKAKADFTKNHIQPLKNEIADMKAKSKQHLAAYQQDLNGCLAQTPMPPECDSKLGQNATNQKIINAAIKSKESDLEKMTRAGGEVDQTYDSVLASCLN